MLFQTVFLALFASFVASAKAADSCAAGAVLGIYAMCGSFPVDCGSGKCCLQGQKCVTGGCTDPKLTDDSGKILTVNAACYGTFDHMTPPSSVTSSAPAVFVTNPSTLEKPTSTPKNIAQKPSIIPSGTKGVSSGPLNTGAPYTNGTGSATDSGSAGGSGAASPTGAGGSTSTSTGLPVSNGASSLYASSLLSIALGAVAFWL